LVRHFPSRTIWRRHRLLFGLIEVVFGIVLLAIAANSYYAAEANEFIPIVGTGGVFRQPPQGLLHIRSTSVSWFQMAAAIYVLVRGFDNVGVGL
jgi:hypothetical protein